MKKIQSTFILGVFALAPIVIVFVLLGQVYKITIDVAEAFEGVIPIGGWQEVVIVNILAGIMAVAVVLALGMVARIDAVRARIDRLDRVLNRMIPGFALLKSTIVGDDEKAAGILARIKPRAGVDPGGHTAWVRS